MSSLPTASMRNNPHARWQRGSSAGSIINWIFYCSIDRSLARSYCLTGKGLGSNIFSCPLTMIGKVSLRCVTSQHAGCPNQAKCLLRSLTPTARKWTLHTSWFPCRGGNLNGPGGSTSLGWKRSGAALPYFSLDEVVNSAGVAANLADLRFDIGEGYNRFHWYFAGFLSDSLGWMS